MTSIYQKIVVTAASAALSFAALEAKPAQAEDPSAQQNPRTAHTAQVKNPSSQESPDLVVSQNSGSYPIIACSEVENGQIGLPSGLEVVVIRAGSAGSIPFTLPEGYSYYVIGGGGIREEVRVCQELLQ